MLAPKKTKFRKMHRGRLSGKVNKNKYLFFGNVGLQAKEPTWISSIQIEALKKTILKYTKKKAKLFIRIFPDKSITKRSKDARMGAGKGSIKKWVAIVYPNTMLFELKNISLNKAKKAFLRVIYKLGIYAKIIYKLK